jgi:hypothetical protein
MAPPLACTEKDAGSTPAVSTPRERQGSRFAALFLSSLRSVNGKHAPFVRTKCGFDSCRRLLQTPVAQRTECCPATAAVAGSTPAGRTPRGRSSAGRAPERHSGEARSIRAVRFSKACGVTEARRAPTSLVRVRPLAGLLIRNHRGPEAARFRERRGNATAPRPGRGTPQAAAAPGKGRGARDPPQGTARGRTARAAASAAGRLKR